MANSIFWVSIGVVWVLIVMIVLRMAGLNPLWVFILGVGLGYAVRGFIQIMWARSKNAVPELIQYRRKHGL